MSPTTFQIFLGGTCLFALNVFLVFVWQMQHVETAANRNIGGRQLKVMDLPGQLRASSSSLHDYHRPAIMETDFQQEEAKEYIMWSSEEDYQPYCSKHFLHNQTWGSEVAPLVDKIEVKKMILDEWHVPDVNVVPTIATYEESEIPSFTHEDLKQLPDPCVIKGAHLPGGQVAKILNGEFHCLGQQCPHEHTGGGGEHALVDDEQAFAMASFLFNQMVDNTSSELQGGAHYAPLQHRLVVEEYLDPNQFRDVTHWYVAAGVPIFVSVECNQQEDRNDQQIYQNFYTEDFQLLDARFQSSPCSHPIRKPATWDTMRSVVRRFGEHLPRSIVRIDLYGSNNEVYFSEFDFTTNGCNGSFSPHVVGGLLTSVYDGTVDARKVTPDYVKNTIEGTSWSHAPMAGWNLMPNITRSYPSPFDLCSAILDRDSGASHHLQTQCFEKAADIYTYPFRCIVTNTKGGWVDAIGAEKSPTFGLVMERVELNKVAVLTAIIAYLTFYRIGTRKTSNQYRNFVVALFLMTIFMYFFTENQGFFSENSPFDVASQSFQAFKAVHPMSSPWICLSHFGTYWFPFAAWTSKSLRNLLFWMLCYELVSGVVNEFAHHTEQLNHVRCMRLSFINHMQTYVFDEFIRVYIVPPFFAYGYLLPMFLWHWTTVFLGFVLSTLRLV